MTARHDQSSCVSTTAVPTYLGMRTRRAEWP